MHTAAALQAIAESQESWPQVIVDASAAAETGPVHDWPSMHVIVQASVASHLTAVSQESWPQVTVQAVPAQSTRPSHD